MYFCKFVIAQTTTKFCGAIPEDRTRHLLRESEGRMTMSQNNLTILMLLMLNVI